MGRSVIAFVVFALVSFLCATGVESASKARTNAAALTKLRATVLKARARLSDTVAVNTMGMENEGGGNIFSVAKTDAESGATYAIEGPPNSATDNAAVKYLEKTVAYTEEKTGVYSGYPYLLATWDMCNQKNLWCTLELISGPAPATYAAQSKAYLAQRFYLEAVRTSKDCNAGHDGKWEYGAPCTGLTPGTRVTVKGATGRHIKNEKIVQLTDVTTTYNALIEGTNWSEEEKKNYKLKDMTAKAGHTFYMRYEPRVKATGAQVNFAITLKQFGNKDSTLGTLFQSSSWGKKLYVALLAKVDGFLNDNLVAHKADDEVRGFWIVYGMYVWLKGMMMEGIQNAPGNGALHEKQVKEYQSPANKNWYSLLVKTGPTDLLRAIASADARKAIYKWIIGEPAAKLDHTNPRVEILKTFFCNVIGEQTIEYAVADPSSAKPTYKLTGSGCNQAIISKMSNFFKLREDKFKDESDENGYGLGYKEGVLTGQSRWPDDVQSGTFTSNPIPAFKIGDHAALVLETRSSSQAKAFTMVRKTGHLDQWEPEDNSVPLKTTMNKLRKVMGLEAEE